MAMARFLSEQSLQIFLDDTKQSCRPMATVMDTAMDMAMASMDTPSLRTVKVKVMLKR